jgi:hypothetical protein
MKRPLSVTLISCLFIVAGISGIIYHASEFKQIFTQLEPALVLIIRLLAILGGVFTLRGNNGARWLLLIWIVYHVILSIYHPLAELIMHVVIMLIVLVGLFNKKANAYFKTNK